MNLKKTTALFLALVLLFSAVGCQKGGKQEEAAKAETVQQTTGAESVAMSKVSETTQAQETSDEQQEEDQEVYEEYELSEEEIYNSILEALIYNTVTGNDELQAVERDIDYAAYPEKYDLRDFGVVTPVKNQLPFGTCWAFGAIAACEISILSEKKTTYKETPLDLSEHHLAWFVNMHLEDNSNQNGEGVWHIGKWETLDGGFPYSASALLATGTGVALEKEFPYRGKKGLVEGEQYSSEDDWSIDPEDRFNQAYELEETRILPTTVTWNASGDYLGLNETALYDIKDELMAGRGVTVAYNAADEAYNDETYASYCREGSSDMHACCIVGWDDTFRKENFRFCSEDGEQELPEGDGAWIVKNNWGAETESFPNSGDFGIPDKKGRSTGYFYLSYHDRTICDLISFDFLVQESEESYYMVDQYDYLHSGTAESAYSENMLMMANEFVAEENEVLRCISLESGAPGVYIYYEVSKLTDQGTGPAEFKVWTSGELECRYAGFHRIDLEKPLELKAGEHYLVTFYQQAEVNGQNVYLVSFRSGTNEKGRDANSDYYVKGIVNPGESWLYSEEFDQWIDWYDLVQYYHTLDENTDFDNFNIKGYADPVK